MNLKYDHALAMVENVIGAFITGSHAYGMNTPTSDTDHKAIAILPPHLVFKTGEPIETLTLHPVDFEQHPEFLKRLGLSEPTDYEIHTLGKFLELAKKANPTILEMLFCEPRFIVTTSPELEYLLRERDIFLSKSAIGSFGGYARQQLIRIKHGMGLALQAGEESQTKDLVDSLDRIVANFNESHAEEVVLSRYEKDQDEDKRIALTFNRPLYLNEAQSLLTEIQQCRDSYMALNAKNRRKEDGQMFKHAAHLIRLLESGLELSQTGKLNVFRLDAKHLLDIRREKYAMEEIITKAEGLFKELDASFKTTALPKLADGERVDHLYTTLMCTRYDIRKTK